MNTPTPVNLPLWLGGPEREALADGLRHHTPCGEGHMVWHSWGLEDQPTLVLLHGGSGSWTHWLRNIAPLRRAGWRVLAADLPGMGDSHLPAGCTDTHDLPPYLHAGLQQLVPHDDVRVVGFSFGGMTAGLWLREHPQDARALVIVGAPGMGLNAPEMTPLKGWRHLPTEAQRDEAHRHNLRVLMLHDPASLDDTALALHRDNVLRDRMQRRRLSRTDILAQALPHLTMPVAGIFGEHDAVYRERLPEVRQAFERLLPRLGGWHTVAGSGHWVQYEAHPAFNQVLLSMLND